jgi:hypothetical protein
MTEEWSAADLADIDAAWDRAIALVLRQLRDQGYSTPVLKRTAHIIEERRQLYHREMLADLG